jgi:hypothetical protein
MGFGKLAFVAALLVCSEEAVAQTVDKEPAAIIEFGGAGAWTFTDARSSFGPAAAVEFTPIEKWLEMEAGVTPLFRAHSTEWGTDLLFKKPWTLSHKVEFMLGVGPEWIHANENGIRRNSVAGEVAPDFMFWPAAKHRFGWYIEPAYEYDFGRGHEQSVGFTAGLLIAIP